MNDPSLLRTNRDLYLFLAALTERCGDRTLEDYLKALWRLAQPDQHQTALTLPRFAALLEQALTAEPPPFDPAWAQAYLQTPTAEAGHPRWQQIILRQIVDLHEMAQTGDLADEQRGFGLDAPRGLRWYNFEPAGFLECAGAGSFAGWREGDPTDRCLVPGPVAVIDEHGQLTTADPRDLEEPIVELAAISWDDFAGFLEAGQFYE